jgi:hypothetical protein
MSLDSNRPFSSIGAALALGICLIISVVLLKGPLNNHKFELKQEGPVFIRFDRGSGELCYTGLAPNGKFATETWLCMAGDKVKAGEAIKLPSREDLETLDQIKKSQTPKKPTKTKTTKQEK